MALAQSHRRGGPLPHAVHGENHRLLEGGGEERAGRMALMMLGEEEPMAPVDAPGQLAQFLDEQALLEELLAAPKRHGHAERAEAGGGEGHVRLEQPLELEEGLVVEGHMIDGIR